MHRWLRSPPARRRPRPEPAPVAPAAEPAAAPEPVKERARPAVRPVQGERRSFAQAQSDQRHFPRRPALRRPARRQYQRRILCGGESGGARAISRRFSAIPRDRARCDRPARLRRVRVHDQGHAARISAGHPRPDQGSAAQPLLRPAHLLPDLRQREGRVRRSTRSRTMRTTSSATRISSSTSTARSAASRKASRRASSRPR